MGALHDVMVYFQQIFDQPLPGMQEYIKKAIEAQQAGHFALVEFLSFCPTNWRTKGPETLKYLEEQMKPIFKIGVV